MYGKHVWVNPGVHDLDGLDEPDYPWSYYGDRGKLGARGKRLDEKEEVRLDEERRTAGTK